MSTINQIDLYDWRAWLDLAPDHDWDGLIPPAPEPEPDPEPEPAAMMAAASTTRRTTPKARATKSKSAA